MLWCLTCFCSWLWPITNSDEGKSLLSDQKEGTWLIRWSESAGSYALVLKEAAQVSQWRVAYDKGENNFVVDGVLIYTSLDQLIETHKKKPLPKTQTLLQDFHSKLALGSPKLNTASSSPVESNDYEQQTNVLRSCRPDSLSFRIETRRSTWVLKYG
jgi:hypothetical protein